MQLTLKVQSSSYYAVCHIHAVTQLPQVILILNGYHTAMHLLEEHTVL